MTSSPLSGVRVVECAGWNGVLAGRLLADGGAHVVRVVPPPGDPLASEPPFFGGSGVSIQETWYNAGKRVVAIDLASGAGRGRLLGLLAEADVLIEDWAPGGGPFTDAELGATNPRLVRVSVTPMGVGGPWERLVVNDLVANALSGSASVTGNAATPPISGYGNQSHNTVGLYAAICALAGLRRARVTGQGTHADLSAHEALVSCTEQVLMQWFFPTGANWPQVARRQGSLHWSGAYEVYEGRTGGGIMVTAALNFMDSILPWLREDGANQDLGDPEKYPDLLTMIKDLPYVMRVFREWVATKDVDEFFFEAQRRHQPFGVVKDIATALQSPQIAARGYLQEREVPGFGSVRFPGRFFRTSEDGPHPSPPVKVALDEIGWDQRETPRTEPGSVPSNRPLEGVRILDFTHVLAGPFGTRVLGDLGADVIKVGTAARSGGANSTMHPYYMSWNRNKRSITLNMATPEGREVARGLAARCDVIIENFSAGVLKRWGLDREAMAAANPGLSVIAMGGMGQTGPWKDFVTFAPTIHALVGLTYLTNPPGEHYLGYGFSLTDHLSGLAGAVATLESLEHRHRTGHGLDIDLSQYELGLGLMGPALLDCLANGVNPEPVGNRHPFAAWAPHGIYRCAGEDRWVAVAAKGDGQWQALCAVMGQPGLAGDPRFASHQARIANQDALDAVIEAWTASQDRYEVMAACQAAGVAAGAVQDAADLATSDPQLAARRFFTTAESNQWGAYGLDAFPARFDGRRPAPYAGTREVGSDTFDVLTGVMGLPDDEVAELMARGALT
ncbi:MAG: CoA transferase [Chloroflexi bacterium]|nr:CoA transferase [Chloroflexota bacterium]